MKLVAFSVYNLLVVECSDKHQNIHSLSVNLHSMKIETFWIFRIIKTHIVFVYAALGGMQHKFEIALQSPSITVQPTTQFILHLPPLFSHSVT